MYRARYVLLQKYRSFFINKVFIFLNEYILGTKKIAKYPTTL